MKTGLFWGLMLAAVAAWGETDWARLNVAAREHAKTPIRAGVPGVRPFWNAHAKAFIHPPAFDFKEVEGAKEYRFTLADAQERVPPAADAINCVPPVAASKSATCHSWTASKPWLPIPADIWDSLKPGYYTLKVEGSGARTFYRAAVFQGPYPQGACSYREAARKVYAAVYHLPQVQGWKTSDDPPKGYDLYCYPAKIMGSMIRALVRYNTADALAIARKMADWLIAHSQPEGAPLAHFPPTYWGDRRDVAVKNAGQNMLLYPAHAALAYLDLAEVLCRAGHGADSRKYRDAALAIARTYAKLQGADGTWPLKVREKDASPVRANRLVPGRYILRLFDRVEQTLTGGSQLVATATVADAINCVPPHAFAQTRDRAFAYVLNGPMKTWNWDGQFEDMDPMPAYKNLQKGVAADTALRLFAQGRVAEGCELVDWCEDQFVVWSDPIHNMDWKHWKTPTALEQYDYYTPIDASMGDMIGAFAAAYKATGNALYLEKAKALADNITRNQRADGTIPTYFDSRKGSDWVNCMIYVADRLEALAAETDDAVFSPAYFWMWNGRLDAKELCAQLDDMRAHGLRNVCIHPFPKGFRDWFATEMEPDYLTEGYLDVFAKVVRHADELGMHAYLYDEGGWPSGGACGRVAASDAEGRFTPREIVRGKDGGLSVARRPYPKGRAAFPSLIERGTTQRFLDLTHEAYAKRLGGALGSTVRIAFTDEPDMPYGAAGPRFAWTADFADEFSRRKGYDIMPHVPALLADKARTNSALAQVRIDVMDVKADMFVERYLAPVRDWCRAHGMMSGGHLNNEDDPERALDRSHGSLLRSLRAMDVPGVDVIWRQLFPADGDSPAKANPFPRYAASAMRQNGGRFALSESFGIFGDSVSPAQMKWIVDYQMVRGINLFVFAYLAQSNARQWMTLFEPHAGPAAPYWDFQPHFFRYIERTSRFVSQGRPGATIVVLLNTRAFWAGANEAAAAAKAHYAVAHALDAMNCDYDFAEDHDLADAEITSGGKLRIGAMEYGAVVLPSEERVLPGAKEKVARFAEAGGIVARGIDLGRVPRTLCVKGTGAQALRVMKRIDRARRIWYVMNEDMEDRPVEIAFPEGGAVVRYDPERDAFESVSGNGSVCRTFRGGETAIYVTGDVPDAAPPTRYEGRTLAIDSGWTLRALVSHVAGAVDFEVRPCADEARPVALGDWRGVLGETFSGKAAYRVEFDSDAECRALLDLGDVKWCASARLNGTDLGARFFGPFRWPVALKKGRNVLEVTVANLLANQVGDDATRDRILNGFKPNGQYDRFQRPFDKLNHESGLFGPVSIKHLRICQPPTTNDHLPNKKGK